MKLTDAQVCELEGIGRRMLFYRLEKGRLRRLEDGSIDPASLSPAAQKRLLPERLKDTPKAASLESQQRNLFHGEAVAALKIPEAQKPIVQKRLDIVQQCVNGNWRSLGYERKRDYVYALASNNRVSGRHVERWIARYKQSSEDPSVLCDRKPGPHQSDPQQLEDWMKLSVRKWYLDDKLMIRQCHERLLEEISRRQAAWTVEDLYPTPSYSTVRRYVRRMWPIEEAARNGPEALKASLGYIDRDYRDLHSLDRVETDEWMTDFLGYDTHNAGRVGRYYLLTFLDTRSLYPLTWRLIEKSRQSATDKKRLEAAELDMLVELIQTYGVPGTIHSDRGRFRSSIFGGQSRYIAGERNASQAVGIMDRLGICRNMGRVHNPRGSRLERRHKDYANFARRLSEHGWVGADTDERKMTKGDAQVAEHMEWVKGRRATTPLRSRGQLLDQVGEMMQFLRERPSNGNAMDGLSPARVFEDSKPAGGFRRISEAELALHTAEHFLDETIETGGIIKLPDGRRYSDPLLLLIEHEQRECVRLRNDHSFISVLPARKGAEIIFADLRTRIGNTEQAALARAHEYQAHTRKAVMEFLNPGSQKSEASSQREIIPRAADSIPERDFFERPEPEAAKPEPEEDPVLVEVFSFAEWEPEVPSLYDDDYVIESGCGEKIKRIK